MAECTPKSLRAAREARHLTRDQMGTLCSVSADTIERWETGKSDPDPDDVDNFAKACDDPTLWHNWMCSHYSSYARRYPDDNRSGQSLPMAIMGMYPEIMDLLDMRDKIERDAADGKIDDPLIRDRFLKESDEVLAAVSKVKNELLRDQ